jgi:hypothetical protein
MGTTEALRSIDMQRIVWGLYGLAAALSVFLVLLNDAVGALDKSCLVIGLLLFGSGLAAILHAAGNVRSSMEKRTTPPEVE